MFNFGKKPNNYTRAAGPTTAEQAKPTEGHEAYGGKTEEEFIRRSVEQFTQSHSAEEEDRIEALEDDRFVLGGKYQWPEYAQRNRTDRPMFSINELGKFRNVIHNEIRQNRPQIKVIAADEDAAEPTANVITDLIRQIHAAGQGDWPQDWAVGQAIDGGWGYLRIVPRYINDETNEQELTVKAVFNRFSVYPDRRAVTPWLEDMEFCFISEWIHKDDLPDGSGEWPENGPGDRNQWIDDDERLVVEKYWLGTPRKVKVKGPDDSVIEHDSADRDVWWCKMTAKEVIAGPRKMPGRWIPVVRVVGHLQSVDGKARKKGLIRDAKDPQRIENFEWTDAIEHVALGVKVGAIGAAGQFEDHADQWDRAFSGTPMARLEYNPVAISEGSSTVLAPPPMLNPQADIPMAKMALVQSAREMLRETTGMPDAVLGQASQEKSGRALIARQQQGSAATYHFTDELNASLRHMGRIFVDLIPHYYDTTRRQRVAGEDGKERMVQLDPDLAELDENSKPRPRAYVEDKEIPEGSSEGVTRQRYNLKVGRYDVRVTTGRSYATRQQEAQENMGTLLPAVGPEGALMMIPELFESMDWPGAEKLADLFRAHRDATMPHLKDDTKGDEIDAKEEAAQLKSMVEQMGPAIEQMQQIIQEQGQELANKEADRMVELIKAKMSLDSEIKESDTQVIVAQIQAAVTARQAARAPTGNNPKTEEESG